MKVANKLSWPALLFVSIFSCWSASIGFCAEGSSVDSAASLPSGVKAVWNLDKAEKLTTPTRERICINGLWRWQPATGESEKVPSGNWGYFKVPGCWPGISDYEQKDCQTLYPHPSWKDTKLGGVTRAWYQREIEIPAGSKERRIALSAEYLNSYAAVFIDDKKVGELRFPGGEIELTSACKPGEKHVLSLLVLALPLKSVLLSYQDTNNAREVQGTVARRGLCGDLFLVSTPSGPRIADTRIETSVRRGEITFDPELRELAADQKYVLRADVTKDGKTVKQFASKAFTTADLKDNRFALMDKWKPDLLWDIDTPQNMFDVTLSLTRAGGELLDASLSQRFGFREFWIDGRDFYLNGTRIFLSAVPLDNAQVSAATANYSATLESFKRLKSFGINLVYTHNYGCEPGSHLSFTEILRAADDAGVLVAMSQPHFSHYEWTKPDANQNNGYARHAEFYVRASQNHPSVIAYAMSHNATGYNEDMNPDKIDGLEDRRTDSWSKNNAAKALRAEAIVKRFDPSRIVYHHSSGDLGSMHTSNFYPNFVPVQELSDWFEHWSTKGVKPMFMCEYGAPFSWDWAMYRGWYKGERSWGSAVAPWEFCLAEWNSQFFGDQAYKISDAEEENIRWEAKQFKAGKAWHRWDYPHSLNDKGFSERYPVFAMYLTDNWRAFRTWEVSAISPWEHEMFWKLRPGVDKRRKELPTDWDNLQRPGLSPDYLGERYERMDMAYEAADWMPTEAARLLQRNNMPLLAYIAGKPDQFTSKDHIFTSGETFDKQVIVINNSRREVTCDCHWSLDLPHPIAGTKSVTVPAGQQQRVQLKFELPAALPTGKYELTASMKFSSGEKQEDAFAIDVIEQPAAVAALADTSVFDPVGETSHLLKELGVKFTPVKASDSLGAFRMLIVGKGALTVDGPAPSIKRVRDGFRVLMFEQSSTVLEQRFGFRTEEYGLRNVFPRVPDHPALAGIAAEGLRDWRGAATTLPAQLKYEMKPLLGPTVSWCGLTVPRLWRCGNRGNVASVLIEKPSCGNFLPIVDGGFSLQYSPLMEYREGRGMMLFCQLDVTGRTDSDPAAETLARNLVRYVAQWKTSPQRSVVYAGEPAGQKYLDGVGISAKSYEGGPLSKEQILVVGPSGSQKLTDQAENVASWLKDGGNLLAIGIDQQDADKLLPLKLKLQSAEHIASHFEPPAANDLLTGIGPADVHNRDPRKFLLVKEGAASLADGVLAKVPNMNAVFFAMPPWQFGDHPSNVKKTYRRTSFAVSRLLGNMGAISSTPILTRFETPVDAVKPEKRWLERLYVDQPEEWDDPYRFFRW